MGDDDAGLGHQLPQAVGHVVDVLHPVVDEEDLALPQQLPADGLAHRPLVVLAHVGEDRLAVGRRRVEQAQVADADEATSPACGGSAWR